MRTGQDTVFRCQERLEGQPGPGWLFKFPPYSSQHLQPLHASALGSSTMLGFPPHPFRAAIACPELVVLFALANGARSHALWGLLVLVSAVLGVEPRSLCMPGQDPSHPQPLVHSVKTCSVTFEDSAIPLGTAALRTQKLLQQSPPGAVAPLLSQCPSTDKLLYVNLLSPGGRRGFLLRCARPRSQALPGTWRLLSAVKEVPVCSCGTAKKPPHGRELEASGT